MKWEFYSIPLQVQRLQDLVMISEELNYYAKCFLKAIQISHVSAILRERCELLFFFCSVGRSGPVAVQRTLLISGNDLMQSHPYNWARNKECEQNHGK